MAKEIPYKIYLEESEMPKAWYNVRADMKKKPAPLITDSSCSCVSGMINKLAVPPTLKVDLGARGSFSLKGIFCCFQHGCKEIYHEYSIVGK